MEALVRSWSTVTEQVGGGAGDFCAEILVFVADFDGGGVSRR